MIMRMRDGFGGFDHMSWGSFRSKGQVSALSLLDTGIDGTVQRGRLPNEGDYPICSFLTRTGVGRSFEFEYRNFEFLWCSNVAPSLLATNPPSR